MSDSVASGAALGGTNRSDILPNQDPFASFEVSDPQMTAWEQDQTRGAVEYLHSRRHFSDIQRLVTEYRDVRTPNQVETRGSVIFSLEEGKSPYGMSISRRDGKSAPVVLLQISEDEAAHRKIIEFMTVSRTGRFIAVGTSEAGTEVTQVQVIDARTGKSLADRSYRVELGGLEWFPDDSGYIYLQGPDHEKTALQDRNKEFAVMWHEIGKPFEQDVEVAGAHAPGARIYGDYDFPFPYISPNGRDVVVSVVLIVAGIILTLLR